MFPGLRLFLASWLPARSFAVLRLAVVLAAGSAGAAEDAGKLAEALKSREVNVRRDAAMALGDLGPAAKPALGALIESLSDDDKQVWSNAMRALAMLGPEAAGAIPALIECLDGTPPESNRRSRDGAQMTFRAAYALAQIGAPAMPPLIKTLEGGGTDERAGAAMALAGMDPKVARDGIPALLANLGHDEEDVQRAVADAFGAIGDAAIPKLTEAIEWKEPRQRATAAMALGTIGKAAHSAVPKLIAQIGRESDARAKAEELLALPRLKPDPEAAVPLYVEALKSPDEPVRSAAVNALLLAREAVDRSIPALMTLIESGDAELARRAVHVLGNFGAAAEPAIPVLLATARKLSQPDEAFLDALARMGEPVVTEVLKTVENEPPDALTADHWSVRCLKSVGGAGIPKLIDALRSPSLSVRIAAARSLGEMGAGADGAEAALMELLNDPDARMRAVALASLVGVKAPQDVVVPRIKAAISDESTAVRLIGLQLVPALGDAARALVPDVMAALKDRDDTVRRSALNAVGANFGEAVPALIAHLDDSTLRPAVIDALIRVGAPSSQAVAKLIEFLPKAPKPQRLQIFDLFARLGSGAGAARPEISGALNDDDPEIRAAAVLAFAGLDREGAMPVLLSRLDDKETIVRSAAIEALGNLGEKSEEAIPKLAALLRSEPDRAAALEGLKRISVQDISALVEMLKVADSAAKIYACDQLRRFGRGKDEVIPPLQLAARDENLEVRRAARRALQRLEQK